MTASGPGGLDAVAHEYVRLALAVARHDTMYVDFHLRAGAVRARAGRGDPEPLAALTDRARQALARLRPLEASGRRDLLAAQLVALEAYVRMLSGERLSWEEQVRLLYGIEPPAVDLERLEGALAALDERLPGTRPLAARLDLFRRRFRIPSGRLARVVKECLGALRERTQAFVPLPRGERVAIRYVRRRPWMAYNWYLGRYASRIELNLDFPSHPSEVLHVLAHEAYPGHHAYHAVQENDLLRRRAWREFSVHTLYSPRAVLSEGLSEVALSIVMSREERLAFLRERIAPLAGLEGLDFASYLETIAALKRLTPAVVEAARLLEETGGGRRRALALMARFGFNRKHSLEHVRFFQRYPAYICTYIEGESLVRSAVGEGAGAAARYFSLFRSPVTPAALLGAGQAGP
jgi:hypothetical protein